MPKIIVTTSRHATPPVRTLAKELSNALFSAKKVNRGRMNLQELFLFSKTRGASRIVIICRGLYGNPGRIVFIDTSRPNLRFYPLILFLKGVKFARDSGIKINRPTSIVPIFSLDKGAEGFAQELASALNIPFVGILGEETNYGFHRILLVESAQTKDLIYVIKFIEKGKDLGLKLLIKKVVYRELKTEKI